MAFSEEKIYYLFRAWVEKTATDAEENELMEWMQEAEEDSELKEFVLGLWQQFRQEEGLDFPDWNSMFGRITHIIQYGKVDPIEKKRKFFSLTKMVAAAAVLIFIVSSYWFLNPNQSDKEIVQQASEDRFKNDVTPAQEQAILTLSDGSTIKLDSAGNGSLATQGNVQVIKLNGKLSYNSTAIAPRQTQGKQELLYNTITTAKGKQYSLTLSDGTGIWLNAGSSLRFPASFTGTERTVELTGEGYFEVAPLSAKEGHGKVPFLVHINSPSRGGSMDVVVLGTHFNINAYNDEAVIKTTLLEGSVKISLRQVQGNNRFQMLTPGQQAQLTKEGDISLVKDANTVQAVAWKYGLFDFDNDELPDIMRQLSRWYDIEVVYNGPFPDGHYSGGIRRQVNLSEVLKMFEALGGVEFSIDGKKIFVSAK